MPIKVGTLITEFAKGAGLDPNNIALPSEQFELPDEVVTAIKSKYFTEEAAKNNPALKAWFFSQALDAADKRMLSVMEELEFGEEDKSEILGHKNTYDRIPALSKKIRELESSKVGATKGQTAQLQEQINKLNEEKANLTKAHQKELDTLRATASQEFTDSLMKTKIASSNLVTEQFSREVMEEFAYKFLKDELAAADAKAIQKGGVLKLVKASDEALDYYADNKLVSFDEFKDSVLSKHKLVAVNSTNPPGTPPPGTPPINPPKGGTPPPPAGNSSFAAMIAASKADLGKAAAK